LQINCHPERSEGSAFLAATGIVTIANVSQLAGLSALATFERAVRPRQPPLADIRNFLLLQYPQSLGTAVHATPLIAALHAAVPGCRIAAAASGFAQQLLRGNPGLERVVATPSPLNDLRGAVSALRDANFFAGEPCAVLLTTGNERSRVTLAAMLSGLPTRVGFTVVPQLSSAPLAFDARLSQITNNLRIVESLGHGAALIGQLERNPELLEPQVFPTAQDLGIAHTMLCGQGIDGSLPVAVFITQTSAKQPKSWREDRFRSVAETLHREQGMQIVFAGTASESAAIDELRSGLSFTTANVAGRTNLLQLSALLSLADVALTLDTGPMHLARAVRLPMVIIAPAWSPAIEWLPLGNPRARILKNADLDQAPEGYIIDEVSVAEVEQSLRELLALYPPRTFSWRTL
jgi:ADP-heptose:LPS heptosyltransferase